MVLRDGDTYWAYGTGDRFPILKSTDLVRWTAAGRALAQRPAWAAEYDDWHPWAPSAIRRGDEVILFFVALSDDLGPLTNCVGVATAPTPAGPFTDRGILKDAGGALVGCGDDRGYGNIDPAPFVDEDGTAWLYVSTDWRCEQECTLGSTMSVIPLDPSLQRAAGPRQPLFTAARGTWEQAPWGPVAENPWVVKRGSTYHLLYSGGAWTGAYGMGHATAPAPTGPFTRSAGTPFLTGTEHVKSPGGGMLVTGPAGKTWLAYHGRSGSLDAPRTLRIDPLRFTDERPTVAGPTHEPQAEAP